MKHIKLFDTDAELEIAKLNVPFYPYTYVSKEGKIEGANTPICPPDNEIWHNSLNGLSVDLSQFNTGEAVKIDDVFDENLGLWKLRADRPITSFTTEPFGDCNFDYIILPASVKQASNFRTDNILKTVVFQEGLEILGRYISVEANISTLVVPSTVNEIEIPKASTLIMKGDVPNTTTGISYSGPYNIYVPAEYYENYINAEYWRQLASIIHIYY